MPNPSPPTLWICIGLPGSGKSTWATAFVRRSPTYRIVSTDQIRSDWYGDAAIQGEWMALWAEVIRRWQVALTEIQQGTCGGVLYDATNVQRRQRRRVIAQAKAMGFTRCLGLWFDVPLSTCLRRNQGRSRQVPPPVIHRMARQLTGAPPQVTEGFASLMRMLV